VHLPLDFYPEQLFIFLGQLIDQLTIHARGWAMKTLLSLLLGATVLSVATFPVAVSAIEEDVAGSQSDTESAAELPELVISASRTETPLEKVGRSVELRRAEEIQANQSQNLTEALSTVSGVRGFEIGGPGSPGVSPIEIRGFRSSGTQLLLNGWTLSDPSSISGNFDPYFSYLLSDGISSVEVLKGGVGVLYGSDGLAGAVNIRTGVPKAGLSGGARFEAGAYATLTESAQLNYGADEGNIFSSVTRVDSAGLDEHGDYENTNLLLGGEYEVIEDKLRIAPLVFLVNGSTDLDNPPSIGAAGELIPNQDTLRNKVDNTALAYGVTATLLADERNTTKASVYSVLSERDFFFDFSGFEFESNFSGRALTVELENAYKLVSAGSEIVTGVRYDNQNAETDDGSVSDEQSRDNYAAFIYDRTDLFEDRLTLAGGYRLTRIGAVNETVSTLEGSAVINVPETDSRVHGSVQQGFRAPTLYESSGKTLDFSTGALIDVGNRNLEQEETLGFDIGVGQFFFDKTLLVDQTFFLIDADETILYDFANSTHVNGGGGQTRGFESSIQWLPWEWYRGRAAYTHLDQAQGLDGLRSQRRPWNWFSISNTFLWKGATLAGELRYRGSQELQFFGVADRLEEGDVTVFDLALSVPIYGGVEAYLRVDNVFDSKYTEAGYQMPRGSAYAGVRFKL